MRWLCVALWLTLAVTGVMLVWRAFAGPMPWMHSPLNAEGIFALAWIALVFLRSQSEEETPADLRGARLYPWLLPAVIAAAFIPWLNFPFLADDYVHIWNAQHATASALAAHFTTPEPDRFFRPFAYLTYAADALWAGNVPWHWRLDEAALHSINALLVYWLAIRIGLRPVAALISALLFGLAGTRPEAVTWAGARFDLLACGFGVLSLVMILRSMDRNRIAHVAAASTFLLLALLSKESAFTVPLLAVLLLWYRRCAMRELLLTCAPLWTIAVLVFIYRWILLGGVGGYQNTNGSPTLFNLRFTTTLKGLFLRSWGAMFFPINWTHPPGWLLALLLSCGALAAIVLTRVHAERRGLLMAAGFVMICTLPVHQFLSIGADLEKSRVLYFPSVGFALLFGFLCARSQWAVAVAGVFIVFQAAALEHNLAVWNEVGNLAGLACKDGAEAAQRDPRRLVLIGVPNVLDGVYFLHTGFPECVQALSPNTLKPENLFAAPTPLNSIENQIFQWNGSRRRIEPMPAPSSSR